MHLEHIPKLILWLVKVTRRSIAMTFTAPLEDFWDMLLLAFHSSANMVTQMDLLVNS
jgi:hypothetical protein